MFEIFIFTDGSGYNRSSNGYVEKIPHNIKKRKTIPGYSDTSSKERIHKE